MNKPAPTSIPLESHVHQMAGFDPQQARQELGIPEGQDPVAMIAVGYYGQPERLPEAHRQRDDAPRSRKPLEAFVYSGQWGRTPDWLAGS